MQVMCSKNKCKIWIENIYNTTNPEDFDVLEMKNNFLVICILHLLEDIYSLAE